MEGEVDRNSIFLSPRHLIYDDIDDYVWQWYQRNNSAEQRLTGKQIQETALRIAKELGNEKFTASSGWLRRWQKRHRVVLVAKGSPANNCQLNISNNSQLNVSSNSQLNVSNNSHFDVLSAMHE